MLLLVGLDNPQSSDPKHALWPRPANCAGYRLHQMIKLVDPTFSERHYLSIPRTNLFPVGPCPKSYKSEALRQAGELIRRQLEGQGTYVVCLGNDVRNAVIEASNLKATMFYEQLGSYYTWLPHPSGRNRDYNEKKMQRKVGAFLRALIKTQVGI